jgi:uncharacterized protein (TIGR03083 family)
MDVWDMILSERVLLADTMDGLTDEQWETPSLCGAWTVKEVAAHLVTPFEVRSLAFLKGVASHGFNFDRASESFARRIAVAESGARLSAILRANSTNRWKPPGFGAQAPLTDVIVHGQDIRRPLGISREIAPDRVRVVLDFTTGGRTFGFVPKGRLDGLRLEAVDLGWSHGDGAAVRGSGEAVMMAVLGRTVVLDELEGGGVGLLRTRLGA